MGSRHTSRVCPRWVFVLLALTFSFTGQLVHASPPSTGTFNGNNTGEMAQNINASCTSFDTLGLQPQNATAEFTFVNGVGSGQIKFTVASINKTVAVQITNLTAMGGKFTGPFGISGNVNVTTLNVLIDGVLRVVLQVVGTCIGGNFQADFSGDLDPGSAPQGADTAGSSSSSHDQQTRDSIREKGEIIADVFYAFLAGAFSEESTQTSALLPMTNGLRYQSRAAGDGFDYAWGLWGTYSHTDSEDDFATTAFDSNSNSILGGMDFQPWDNIVVGVALGYDQTDMKTGFNLGEEDLQTFSVIPYFGILLTDYVDVGFDLSADGSIGFSFVDIDQFRTTGGARVSSSTDANHYFFSGNLTAGQSFGGWYLSATSGILVAREDTDGFTESDGTVIADRKTDFGQINVGGRAAYQWGSFEPFASVTYNYEYNREDVTVAVGPQPENDSSNVDLGLGLRWYSDSGITASFEWSGNFARENYDSDTYMFTLRGDF